MEPGSFLKEKKVKRSWTHFIAEEEGQTVVEYLLLLAMAFITAYILMTVGPLPRFTTQMLTDIRTRLGNVVRNGQMESQGLQPGSPGHPTDPRRFKALHL